MASDQQVALSRGPRGGSSHLNRTGRQVVPAFLQKLYEMVNDMTNSNLIRWSEAGDSFFVLDHERFAREVLGRWFKHQNFSSFVRQLNMYGFHKIPHLQQGVLKSDTDTEYWNFEHAHFHRGQPDMLCLIQRKKQAPQPGDEPTMDVRDTPHPTPAPNPNLSAGQILDINSIVNGITAIKRHQSTISADLNELKNSNQLLWQEALSAREKHKKQQDTINRILKFLAGVFGNNSTAIHKANAMNHDSRAMMPRKAQRLMIGPGPGKGVGIVDVEDEEMMLPPSPLGDQFTTPETPAASVLYPSMTTSETRSPAVTESASSLSTPIPSSATPFVSILGESPTIERSRDSNTPHPDVQSLTPGIEQPPAVSTQTSLTTTSGISNPDPMQAAFAELLNAPGQMQRLLAALQAQQSFQIPDPMPPPGVEPPPAPSSSQLTSYEPHYDFSREFQEPNPVYGPLAPNDLLVSPSSTSADTIAPYESLAQNANRLQRSYKDAQEIDKDVSALHTSITSLIESLGLDPNLLNNSQTQDSAPPIGEPSINEASLPSGMDEDLSNTDFDFDAFLNEFSGPGDYSNHVDSTAFLDEVHSVSDAASPNITTTTNESRKRKSDAAELDRERTKSTTNSTLTGTKAKKKR